MFPTGVVVGEFGLPRTDLFYALCATFRPVTLPLRVIFVPLSDFMDRDFDLLFLSGLLMDDVVKWHDQKGRGSCVV